MQADRRPPARPRIVYRPTPKDFWTYQAPTPPPLPPPGSPMTEREWTSLTPGMRREIWRGK